MARWETTGPFSLGFGRTGLFIRTKILLESGIANRREQMRRGMKNLAAIIMVTAVAACAPAPVKVAPPPIPLPAPPPPAMPLPPGGAALSMTIPPVGLDGVRVTPNRGLSRDEQIWHFRSALNVAALNCQGPYGGRSRPSITSSSSFIRWSCRKPAKRSTVNMSPATPDKMGCGCAIRV